MSLDYEAPPLNRKSRGYLSVKDTGYTVICPQCAKRSGEKESLVGKERSVYLVFCSDNNNNGEACSVRFYKDRVKRSL